MSEYSVRIAMLEERLTNMNLELKRIEENLRMVEHSLNIIEKQEPLQTLASRWMLSAVWTAAGGAMYLIAKFFGVL